MTPSNAWNTLDSAVNVYNESDREDLAVKRALRDAVFAYVRQADGKEVADAYVKLREATPLPPPSVGGGAVFPNYGKTKNQPVAGASRNDLEYYRAGCLRTLADDSKSRWHEKEHALLAAIDAELAK